MRIGGIVSLRDFRSIDFYEFGEFRLDPQNRVLWRGHDVVGLTPKVLEVLLLLLQNGGQVITKDELMRAVWPDSFVEESNLTQTVFMLRKALRETPDQRYILTVQGCGYRFATPVKKISRNEHPQQNDARGSAEPDPTEPVSATSERVVHPGLTPAPSLRAATSRWRSRLLFAGVSVALLTAGLIGCFYWYSAKHQRPVAGGRTMLPVLPFENLTGDSKEEYLSDGLTEEMISRLGNLDPQHLGIIARTSVMHYKNSADSPRPGRSRTGSAIRAGGQRSTGFKSGTSHRPAHSDERSDPRLGHAVRSRSQPFAVASRRDRSADRG